MIQQTALSRQVVIEMMISAVLSWRQKPLNYPIFILEQDYLEFFYFLLRYLTFNDTKNVLPEITTYLEQASNKSVQQICILLDQQKADGMLIWQLMAEGRLILRKQQRDYNKQISGKSPKGLTRCCWMDYNHWTVACTVWEGLVESVNPYYKVSLENLLWDCVDDPIDGLLDPEKKLFWGMRKAFVALGDPFNSNENYNNAIYVRPFDSWLRYTEVQSGPFLAKKGYQLRFIDENKHG